MHTTLPTPAAAPQSPLAWLLTLAQYQERSATVFPAVESLRWYIRQHRQGLIDAGALLYVAGRQRIMPGLFDAFVLDDGKRTVQRRGGAQ